MIASKSGSRPAPRFVQIALPLPIRQTFTYSLPAGLAENIRIGARLVVPFGNRQLTGYVVGLSEALAVDSVIDPAAIKDVLEILDEVPLLTEEILKLTEWTADYYLASWGEILKASLPAGMNSQIEQFLLITPAGRDYLLNLAPGKLGSPKARLLRNLNENFEASLRTLSKEFGTATAKRLIRELAKQQLAASYHRTLPSKAKPKRMKAVRLLPAEMHLSAQNVKSGRAASDDPGSNIVYSEKQAMIIEALLAHNGEIGFAELLQETDVSVSTIQTLEKRHIVQTFIREVLRDPLKEAVLPPIDEFELTEGQRAAFDEIKTALENAKFEAFLLHGITGSGKTEIYIRAMKTAMIHGKSSLMLVPEIALTPIFSRRLRSVFGNDVAILHSNLSSGERFDEWRRIRSGEARIVIGTRSAVFAPLENIGLIIVDEEHDGSYRQQESPFYHARDVAIVRGKFAEAIVVLGSATPSIESYYNSQNDKYRYLSLANRIGNRPLAVAELIDMREVFRQNKRDTVFSPQLLEAIEETHSKGEQSIILLNRRGFSQFILCRSCGESMRCRNCDITLTFHKRDQILLCHYCGFGAKVPKRCVTCNSRYIYFVGEGTEQLEDLLQTKFPGLRIARVDRDTTSRRKSFEETLNEFSEGEIDMLVGTQMLAKGHDFPNVTLVGVISVDMGLSMPDFRAAERTFQLLTQVAGRAGRGDLPGRVLIQTFHPDNYALKHASLQQYEPFYLEEIRFRQNLGYPPFCALACITIHHENFDYATLHAELLKDCLINANKERQSRILGVAPAPLARLKGEHRLQIILKSSSRKKLRENLDAALGEAQEKMCDLRIINVEIDPVNMM